jgi:phytoene synthase
MVRDVGRDARHGVIFFPVDELAALGVKARQLLACDDTPEVRALLAHAATRAQAALAKADTLRPRDMGQAALPGVALSRMAHALLREMGRDQYALVNQRVSLTPTRMLWAAWTAQWAR